MTDDELAVELANSLPLPDRRQVAELLGLLAPLTTPPIPARSLDPERAA